MRATIKLKFCLELICLVFQSSIALAVSSASIVNDESAGVRQAELQWVVCESSPRLLFTKIEAEPDRAKARDVYYADTPDLDLYSHGAVIRTRITKGKEVKIKTTAKVNYENADLIPWKFLESKDYKCEKDMYLDKEKIGCSLYSYPEDLDKVTTADQDEFIQNESGFNQWNKMALLGPAQSLEWSWQDDSLNLVLVVEKVQVDDVFSNIELSTRVDIKKSQQTFARIQKWLLAHQVKLCPSQKGRTAELLKVLTTSRLSQL